MFHPEWAADIDVHFRYPGLEVAGDIFEPIWAQRTTVWCGNQPVCLPSLADAIMIGAVHAIRSRFSRRHREELDFLVGRCSAMDVTLLLQRADELGALATARPFLERLKPWEADYDWGEASAEWRLRTEFPESSQRRALLWKQASPRERLGKLRLALFPPASALIKETKPQRRQPCVRVLHHRDSEQTPDDERLQRLPALVGVEDLGSRLPRGTRETSRLTEEPASLVLDEADLRSQPGGRVTAGAEHRHAQTLATEPVGEVDDHLLSPAVPHAVDHVHHAERAAARGVGCHGRRLNASR